MSIKRRRTIGVSLLIAGTGISMTIACGDKDSGLIGSTSGNLMAPPLAELCIEVEPETASVTVNENAIADGACTEVYQDNPIYLKATAEGFQDYEEELTISEDTTYSIEMEADTE
jgi:hypothetical protein